MLLRSRRVLRDRRICFTFSIRKQQILRSSTPAMAKAAVVDPAALRMTPRRQFFGSPLKRGRDAGPASTTTDLFGKLESTGTTHRPPLSMNCACNVGSGRRAAREHPRQPRRFVAFGQVAEANHPRLQRPHVLRVNQSREKLRSPEYPPKRLLGQPHREGVNRTLAQAVVHPLAGAPQFGGPGADIQRQPPTPR